MTAPTVRAYNGRVLVTFPESALDNALTALAQGMAESSGDVESALDELGVALWWLSGPQQMGELDRVAYERRRDVALETLRRIVGLVALSLAPGAAKDFGRDLEQASASVLARSTEDLIHSLEARRG